MVLTSKSQKSRSALLDCIRSVAILAVMIYHAVQAYPDKESVGHLARLFYRYGNYGVDMFFPLSGYLIARYLLLNTGGNAIRTFFLRRAFRILPLYLVAVTLFLMAMLFLHYDADLIPRIWIPYFFLTAWFVAIEGAANVPYTITWTLSVEEFSYITFGLVALISRRFLPVYLVLCAVLPTFLRWAMAANGIGGFWYLPLTRIDSIAFGAVLSWVLMHRSGREAMIGLLAIFAVMWGAGKFDPFLAKSLGMNVVPLATCILIVVFDVWLRGVSSPVIEGFSTIGFYCYFLYLIHYFNIHGLDILFTTTGLPYPNVWIFALTAITATYVQAAISFRFFEAPMMRYGRRLENPPTPARKEPAPALS